MTYVFQFLYSLVSTMTEIQVPGFTFTFWDFAVGSFLIASGIVFVRYLMNVNESDDSTVTKKRKGKKK